MGNVFGTRKARDFQIAMNEKRSVEEDAIWKVIEKEESEFEIVLTKVIKAIVDVDDDAPNGKESEFHAFTTAMLEYEKERLSIEKQRWADTNQWSELERERLDIERERLNSQLAHQRKMEENQNEVRSIDTEVRKLATNLSTIESQQRTIESQQRTIESQEESNAKLVKEIIKYTKKINGGNEDQDEDGNGEDDEADEGEDAVES